MRRAANLQRLVTETLKPWPAMRASCVEGLLARHEEVDLFVSGSGAGLIHIETSSAWAKVVAI